jgi:hypothetical protein
LALAELLSVVPFARASKSTFGLGAEEVALHGALVAEGVPEAVVVSVAASGFDVGIATAGNADGGGSQPHAAGDGFAGNVGGKRRSFVSDGGAGVDARSGGCGPSAAKIRCTLSGSGVLGRAGENAGLSGGRGGTVEAGGADFAAGVTVGTALGDGSVLALEAALEVDPFALAVGIAECGGSDALAGRGAGTSDVVPHTVGGLVVA